jgi:Flp pilus assembly protein TadG
MVALLLVILVGMGALAVDVGYLMVNRNELQNVADAAALAATRQLGVLYEGMTFAQQQAYVVGGTDESLIRGAAASVALSNQAGGVSIAIDPDEIVIGTWDPRLNPDHFSQTNNQPDAVRVIARRDQRINNPVSTFFARVFGIQSAPVTAVATAALSGQSTTGPGGLTIPIGISIDWFERGYYCGQRIQFHPTDSCAGWHTFEESPSSASRLRRILQGLQSGTYTSPEATAGSTVFNATGGTVVPAVRDIQDLYEYMRTRDDDGNAATWTTEVVVFDFPCGRNPGQSYTVLGFATVVMEDVIVNDPRSGPQHTLVGTVICDNYEPGRGGGGDFGTMGTIPGLVQ